MSPLPATPVEPANDLSLALPPLVMSEEQYLDWVFKQEASAEWVAGEVVLMSPADLDHSDLQGWLLSVLRGFAEEHKLGRILHDMLLRLSRQKRYRIPDIFFVAETRLHILNPTMLSEPPDLVVEIVSPDCRVRDRQEKLDDYAQFGIAEYWILDPASESLDAYTLLDGAYVQLELVQDELHSHAIPGFRLPRTWLSMRTRPSVKEALQSLGVR